MIAFAALKLKFPYDTGTKFPHQPQLVLRFDLVQFDRFRKVTQYPILLLRFLAAGGRAGALHSIVFIT